MWGVEKSLDPKKEKNRCKTHQFWAWLKIIGPQIAGRFTTMVPTGGFFNSVHQPNHNLRVAGSYWPSESDSSIISHDGSMGLEYFYLHENHKNQPNAGEYTSPMDPMGTCFVDFLRVSATKSTHAKNRFNFGWLYSWLHIMYIIRGSTISKSLPL